MTAPARLAVFAALLVLAFGGGAALGGAVGPEPADDRPPAVDHGDHGLGG